jgi:hypothetical protein
MRFLFRFVSLILLALAVIAGVVDSIQSVAANALMLTSLGSALFTFDPDLVLSTESYVEQHMSAFVWEDVIGWVLMQPAFAVFLALSLLLYLAAYRRERSESRFGAGGRAA